MRNNTLFGHRALSPDRVAPRTRYSLDKAIDRMLSRAGKSRISPASPTRIEALTRPGHKGAVGQAENSAATVLRPLEQARLRIEQCGGEPGPVGDHLAHHG